MAELHIDNDWKKQAHAEKKRLAEEQAKPAPAPAPEPAAPVPTAGAPMEPQRGDRRGPTAAGFGTLVQSVLTQALYYLGELAMQGSAPALNLDMAKHQIDLLGILEEKTRNNLTEDEQKLLDTALYEVRNRFVSIAAQMI